MKFAICNETFGDRSFADTFSTIAKLGYTGVEIAPFTFAPHDEPFDLRKVPAERIVEVRTMAEDEGLEIIGLHWLLAKTEGNYLTSPDPTVRRRTADYMKLLAEVCADLGGKVLVLGSPKQRNLLPGISYHDAEGYAVEVLHGAVAACMQFGVTIGLEPLGPADGNFMLTAEAAKRLSGVVWLDFRLPPGWFSYGPAYFYRRCCGWLYRPTAHCARSASGQGLSHRHS